MRALLTTALELLMLALVVGFVARRVRVHYNVALVVAGIAVGATQVISPIGLSPDIVLQLFLPVLLIEAAISTDLRRLRENLGPILLLALPGLLLSLLATGGLLLVTIGLPLGFGLLLGAILAPTDTIAVLSGFRSAGAPPRLRSLVENESLFNDGTGLVAYGAILAVLTGGGFELGAVTRNLAWVMAVGAAVGWLCGLAASLLARQAGDHLNTIVLTVALAYSASLLAQAAGASGVLAVVAAGLALRAHGWAGLDAPSRLAVRSFWEVAAFAVNSVVFLLVGMQVDGPALMAAAPALFWVLVALVAGRLANVYPLLALLRGTRLEVPLCWQHLLVWANLKGSLSMAVALSLPADLPYRELLVTVTFGCALVTLTVQGLSLAGVARRLGIGHRDAAEEELEGHQGQLLAARAGQAELDRLQHMGLLALADFQRLRAQYQQVIARSERGLRDLAAVRDTGDSRRLRLLRRHLLLVEKSAVREAVGSGILAEEVGARLARELDGALDQLGNE